MGNLKIFENPRFGKVRVVPVDGEPWFVGKDVAEALGYSNPRKALSDHVDTDDKGVTKCDTLGGTQEMTIINESGLYSLALSSKLPSAREFKRWITKEIFADAVSVSKDGILVGALAKLLHQNGVEIGQKRLFQWLRDHGYLMKSGADKNMPTQKARELELFKVKERTINNPDGSVRLTRTTLVTGKGQQYFVNKFLAGR